MSTAITYSSHPFGLWKPAIAANEDGDYWFYCADNCPCGAVAHTKEHDGLSWGDVDMLMGNDPVARTAADAVWVSERDQSRDAVQAEARTVTIAGRDGADMFSQACAFIMQRSSTGRVQANHDSVATLERLAKLRDTGVVSSAESEQTKTQDNLAAVMPRTNRPPSYPVAFPGGSEIPIPRPPFAGLFAAESPGCGWFTWFSQWTGSMLTRQEGCGLKDAVDFGGFDPRLMLRDTA